MPPPPRPGRRALLAAGAVLALLATASPTAAAVPPPAADRPVAAPPFGPSAPPNPATAANGGASIHGDSASAKAFPTPGPGTGVARVGRSVLGAACPTLLHGRDALPIALCTDMLTRVPALHLLDPRTGRSLATHELAAGDLLGGVYAYLDRDDRVVLVDGTRHLLRIAHERDGGGRWRFRVTDRTPIGAAVPPGDGVVAVLPSHDGRIWFATTGGVVGVVDRAGAVATRRLPGERVANSISTVPGQVAVVTDHALYAFDADAPGPPRVRWRHAYDRGPHRKPGVLSWGSGTTPVYFGPREGTEYVTITDNAHPHMRLTVRRAADGAEVCTLPLFAAHAASGTDDAPVASGRSVFVTNAYGYTYPPGTDDGTPSVPATAPFVGGLTRVDVEAGGTGCRTVWTDRVRTSSLPRLSMPDRVLYVMEQLGPLANDLGPYALAPVDADTGAVGTRTPVGFSLVNPLRLGATVTPDRVLYQGTVTGVLRLAPTGW
ncbi:hypothetical protein GCM10010124_17990 [Pilimelia terevasa]|uniref:Uncharacterized protein n=1 Tax=Pilimelia terevasa TaxID=53372 RepID=A0A8J3BMT9_9ACTN|nr:hypothetical protein [Pilimelia terevasa]GGK25871.1 hypothetical protein GCM10010124_17990 [Pilimelia terevasa]